MDTTRDKYTINPQTRRKIKIGTQTWKRLAAKFFMIDRAFTDQVILNARALKVKDGKEHKEHKEH